MYVSIIVPVYKSKDSIEELSEKIKEVMHSLSYDYELILIDDGSPDDSWRIIKRLSVSDERIKALKLSRNFGQHKAITAGFEYARGDVAIVMDCDLQHDPKYIVNLIAEFKKNYDIIYTKNSQRQHSYFKNVTAKLFKWFFDRLSKKNAPKYHLDIGAYSLVSRKVINEYLKIKDTHRHYLMILHWLGFSSSCIEIEHAPRKYGKSSYDFKKLIDHALDGITSQSDSLLYLSIKLAFIFLILSVLATLVIIVSYFIFGFKEGWASVIVTILLSTSAILLSLGVNGIYIGKNFDQSKGRPLFVVDEKINITE